MTADAVAAFGVNHLPHGPSAIPGESNQQMMASFMTMSRKEAGTIMGEAIVATRQTNPKDQQ